MAVNSTTVKRRVMDDIECGVKVAAGKRCDRSSVVLCKYKENTSATYVHRKSRNSTKLILASVVASFCCFLLLLLLWERIARCR